jgi:ABC-type glycerol-3-phosphate transport system substrate-binding protein
MIRAFSSLHRFAFAAAAILLGGCKKPADPPPNPAPLHSAPLKLLVVDDRALAKQVARVKGEWKARSGGDLEIRETTSAEIAGVKTLGADAVIYPTAELGSLAERHLIRPLPPGWLSRDEFHGTELFEPGGLAETRWGEQSYAVPFGSPVFVVLYRRDLFDRYHLEPPRTWADYKQRIEFIEGRTKELPELRSAAIEPLAAGWAGKMLLARAAAAAKHRDYYATLFDKETMAPQIASPPFVRALEELVAAAKAHPSTSLAATPAEARRAVLSGECGVAITWPTAAGSTISSGSAPSTSTDSRTLSSEAPSLAFAELPGTWDVYNPKTKAWEASETPDTASSPPSPAPLTASKIPLLSISGRLGSVAAESQAGEAAFRLLAWLSGDEWGPQICSASSETTLFRRAHLSRPERWIEPQLSRAAAKEYAEVVAGTLTRSQWLECPRIPGQAEYMASLDDAVRAAVEGKQSPAEALAHASSRWSEITTQLGLDSQRAAYSRGLGLEP